MQDNKYQITKTVRFRLEPEDNEKAEKELLKVAGKNLSDYLNSSRTPELSDDNNIKSDLSDLVTKLKTLISELKLIVYKTQQNRKDLKKSQGQYIFNDSVEIKYRWMQSYLKKEFFEYRDSHPNANPPSSYSIGKINFIQSAIGNNWIYDVYDQTEYCEDIDSWFGRISEISKKINNFNKRETINQYEKQRFPEIALVLQELNKTNNIEFIKELMESLCLPNNDSNNFYDKQRNIIKKTIKEIEEMLTKKLAYFLPFQSDGYPTKGGSFNYFTINKSEKEIDSIKTEYENNLKNSYAFYDKYQLGINNQLALNFFIQFYNISKQETLELLKLEESDLNKRLSIPLSYTYEFLKLWKAQQKSELMESFSKKDYEKAKNNQLFQFKTERLFEKFKSLCLEIESQLALKQQEEAKQLEQKDKNKLDKLNKTIKSLMTERSEFFSLICKEDNDKFTKRYRNYCNSFKKVAIDYGNIKVGLNAIAKERIQSQQLKYWCLILEEKDAQGKVHSYLCMIPRDSKDNLQRAYKEISSLEKGTKSDNNLYYFESLTLKALRKLCFKTKDNSFRKNLPSDFPECEQKKNAISNKGRSIMIDRPENERVMLFQTALKSCKNILGKYDSVAYDKLTQKTFKTLNEFETELNKVCYERKVCSAHNIREILKKYKSIIFEITSDDIQHRFIENATPINKPKFTTKIWDSFWNEQSSIRINPEVKLFWRYSKPSRVHKYGSISTENTKNWKNRYKNPQYTVAFTFTENAECPKLDYAFTNEPIENDGKTKGQKKSRNSIIKDNINEFNRNLNKNIQFAIGIDTGTHGLAYASALDKNYVPIEFNVISIKNDQLDFAKACEIEGKTRDYFVRDRKEFFINKKLYDLAFNDNQFEETKALIFNSEGEIINNTFYKTGQRVYRLIENPSYFIDEKLYNSIFNDGKYNECYHNLFNEDKVAGLDLTNAKVISNKIVLNGDMYSHLKLELLKAQRVISRELRSYPNEEIGQLEDRLTFNNKTLIFNNNGKYDCIMTDAEIFEVLDDFRKTKKVELSKIEERINNYRKAIVANMVGVITKIYSIIISQYNTQDEAIAGNIAFEGLAKNNIENLRIKFEGDITLFLRNALLNKLQQLGLVPPFSEINKLSDTEKFYIKDSKATVFEEEDVKAYGVVKFVSKNFTSSCCPICGCLVDKKSSNYIEQMQGNVHPDELICNQCGFDSYKTSEETIKDIKKEFVFFKGNIEENLLKFKSLKSNDMIAAYLIGKRSLM